MLSSQRNNNGSGVGQSDLRDDGRPATQRRTLQSKEEEDPSEEAFDAGAFSQLVSGPGGWEAGAVFLAFGIPGDDGDGSQHGVDLGDQAQTPIACIQADDARMDVVKAERPFQQRAGKGRIMDVGWGEQKEKRQARAAAK